MSLQKIKKLVDDDKCDEALKLCEEAVRRSDGENYGNYMFLATCAIRLKQHDKAIVGLEKALSLNPPENNLPKLWKTLADSYEETSQWDQQARALTNIYAIAKSKGNEDKALQLAESITDCFTKAKAYEKGCEFILLHLGAYVNAPTEHILKLVSCSNAFQCTAIEIAKKSVSRPTLGSSHSTATAEEIDAAWLSPTPYVPYALSAAQHSGTVCTDGVRQLLLRHLQSSQQQALNRGVWTSLLNTALEIGAINLQDPDIVTSHLVEAWFFSPTTEYSRIGAFLDIILEAVPKHPVASLGKAMGMLEQGRVRSARPYVLNCTAVWLAELQSQQASKKASSLSTLASSSISNVVSPRIILSNLTLTSSLSHLFLLIVAVGGALDGFRGLTVQDMLHCVEEAKRREQALARAGASLRGGLKDLVLLSRLRALAAVNQNSQAASEAIKTLPKIFSAQKLAAIVVRETEGDAIKTDESLDSASIVAPLKVDTDYFIQSAAVYLPTRWLIMMLLNDLGMHSEVQRCADAYLETSPAEASWVLSEKGWAQLMSAVASTCEQRRAEGVCRSPSAYTILELEVSEAVAKQSIRTLQAALGAGDSLCEEIDASVRVRMGIAMWLAGGKLRKDKTGCLSFLLSGTKADPSNCSVYAYIGHHYFVEQGDLDRAEKCYLKALGLSPLNREAGVGLSEVYLRTGAIEKAQQLWADVAAMTVHASWCHALSGRFHLCRGEFDKAVECFQRALELDDVDAGSWHGLGVAYSALKQNAAAYKALLRASEFASRDSVVECILADVERKLCMLPEAMHRYESVIARIPNDLVALKGIADTCQLLAYQHLTAGWPAGAGRCLLRGIAAIDKIMTAGSLQTDSKGYNSVWKLLGDMCCFAHALGPNDIVSSVHVLGSCPFPSYDAMIALLERGAAAYEHVVHTFSVPGGAESAEAAAAAHYDLGSAYYFQASAVMQSRGQGSGLAQSAQLLDSVATQLYAKASKSFAAGLRLNPLNSNCWNGLGLCTLDDDQARQACFVRATQIDSNAAAYANLGLLLVLREKYEEAKECFSALQLIESNPLIWISLGCIFERMDSGGDKATGTMLLSHDAYIAAMEIAKPTEALLGSALSWLRLNGNLRELTLSSISASLSIAENPSLKKEQAPPLVAGGRSPKAAPGGGSIAGGNVSDRFGTDEHQLRHEAEGRLRLFLQRRPVHPLAWAALAWTSESRGSFEAARQACRSGLQALDTIAKSLLGSGDPSSALGLTQARLSEATLLFVRLFRRCSFKLMLTLADDSQDGEQKAAADLSSKEMASFKNLLGVCALSYEDIMKLMGPPVQPHALMEITSGRGGRGDINETFLLGVLSAARNSQLAEAMGIIDKMLTYLETATFCGETHGSFNCLIKCTYLVATRSKDHGSRQGFFQILSGIIEKSGILNDRASSQLNNDVSSIQDVDEQKAASSSSSRAGSAAKGPLQLHLECSVSAIAICAEGLSECDRVTDARTLLTAGTRLFPQNAFLWTRLAELWEATGEGQGAVDCAVNATRLALNVIASGRDSNDGVGITQVTSSEAAHRGTDCLAPVTSLLARAAAVKASVAVREGVASTKADIFPSVSEVVSPEKKDSKAAAGQGGQAKAGASRAKGDAARSKGGRGGQGPGEQARSVRSELLRGLHLDPTNMLAWASLMRATFSDAVLLGNNGDHSSSSSKGSKLAAAPRVAPPRVELVTAAASAAERENLADVVLKVEGLAEVDGVDAEGIGGTAGSAGGDQEFEGGPKRQHQLLLEPETHDGDSAMSPVRASEVTTGSVRSNRKCRTDRLLLAARITRFLFTTSGSDKKRCISIVSSGGCNDLSSLSCAAIVELLSNPHFAYLQSQSAAAEAATPCLRDALTRAHTERSNGNFSDAVESIKLAIKLLERADVSHTDDLKRTQEQLSILWRQLGGLCAAYGRPKLAELCYNSSSAAAVISAKLSQPGQPRNGAWLTQLTTLNKLLAALAYFYAFVRSGEEASVDESKEENSVNDEVMSGLTTDQNLIDGSDVAAAAVAGGGRDVGYAGKVRALLDSAAALAATQLDSEIIDGLGVKGERCNSAVQALRAVLLTSLGLTAKAESAAQVALESWHHIDFSSIETLIH